MNIEIKGEAAWPEKETKINFGGQKLLLKPASHARYGVTTFSDWTDFPKLAKQKLRVANILSKLQLTAAEGVGLGSRFPVLTEKIFAHQVDSKWWNELRSHGLDIPEYQPESKSMREREEEALSLIKPYVSKARPDLLSPLGL